jgi:hypothetical protein
VSHAELESRFRQAIQPTSIDSVAKTSSATPCPYSPWSVTVANAANITVQPSAEPHNRVCARASGTTVVSSSDPVTKWNQRGYPHRSRLITAVGSDALLNNTSRPALIRASSSLRKYQRAPSFVV